MVGVEFTLQSYRQKYLVGGPASKEVEAGGPYAQETFTRVRIVS